MVPSVSVLTGFDCITLTNVCTHFSFALWCAINIGLTIYLQEALAIFKFFIISPIEVVRVCFIEKTTTGVK